MFLYFGLLKSQDFIYSAGAIWPLTDPATGGTGFNAVTQGYINASPITLVGLESTGYTGPQGSPKIRIIGNAWPANQTTKIENVYMELAVSPKEYSNFYIDSLSFYVCILAIDNMKVDIYYSTDPSFSNAQLAEFTTGKTNNYLPRDILTKYTIRFNNIKINNGGTLYFRFYPYVYNDPSVRTGKYICFKDITVSGRIESIEMPSNVQWFKDGDPSPIINGKILSNTATLSDSLKLLQQTKNFEIINSNDSIKCALINKVSDNWFSSTQPNDKTYIEFSAGPKTGGTLYTDSLTLYIGANNTGDLKFSLVYSFDPLFSQSNILINDFFIPQDQVLKISIPFNITINNKQKIYIRILPYSISNISFNKCIAISNITLYGKIKGVTYDPPTVTTINYSYLSTTHVITGGNVVYDGGAPVTEKGVVWNTTGNPTINDSKTLDGSGSGSFISHVTGLTPATTYYLRAYAINDAGVSYGNEISFTTLSQILPPTVTTGNVTDILVKTAKSSGMVTDWGGDTVKQRGLCWNTSGNPTINDSYIDCGEGLGSFTATLYPLEANTTYYVRAYAINSSGVGYGNEVVFTTQTPAPDVTKVVAKDGSGDFTTIQAAFNSVPDYYTGKYIIYVKPGVYKEKAVLAKNKVNVILKADHPDSVIITYDDYAGKPDGLGGTLGTSNSYSVSIDADDFTAINITFQNTIVNDGTFANQQAVALRTNGDRQSFYHCKILGYQDTYYSYSLGRVYMKNCYIEGSVDFIFGQSTVVFDSCELLVNREGGVITAASTNVNSKFGYVFRNCKIHDNRTGFNGPISSIYLGRPWQGNPKVVYMYCEEPSIVAPAGWTYMNSGLNPLFAEYKCFGPGYKPDQRSTNPDYKGIQLTDQEAIQYTIKNIFSRKTNPAFGIDWIPDTLYSCKLNQTITFQNIGDINVSIGSVNLSANASSKLKVYYVSSDSSIAEISGDKLIIKKPGTVTITAYQPGNFLYKPAEPVSQTITIKETGIQESSEINNLKIYPNPTNGMIFIDGLKNNTKIDIYSSNGLLIKSLLADSNYLDLTNLKTGIYFLKINNQYFKIVIR